MRNEPCKSPDLSPAIRKYFIYEGLEVGSSEAGSWKLEAGGSKLEAGGSKLEARCWKLEAGGWRFGNISREEKLWLFAKVLDIVAWRFIKLQAMQGGFGCDFLNPGG